MDQFETLREVNPMERIVLIQRLHREVCEPAGLSACLCGSYAESVRRDQAEMLEATKAAIVEARQEGYYQGLRESGASAVRERADILAATLADRDAVRAEQREADASEIRALVEALNTTHPHPVKLDWCNWCSSFWDFQRAAAIRSQSPSLKGARNE